MKFLQKYTFIQIKKKTPLAIIGIIYLKYHLPFKVHELLRSRPTRKQIQLHSCLLIAVSSPAR